MKRLLTIGMIAAVCLLSGCGNGDDGQTVTLDFWHIQTNPQTKQVTEDAVGRFEAASDNVSVAVTPIKNDPFKQKLAQAMASGSVPDVFHTWGGGVLKSYVDTGHVADVTELLAASGLTDRVLPVALDLVTFDGKTYAVPMDVSVVPMWYNRALFEKHGVAVPKTFAELKAACVKLRRAGVIPIALGNKDKWPGAFYFAYLAARTGGKQPFADAAAGAPGGTFEHASFIEAGRLLQEFVAIRPFNDGVNAKTDDEARGHFIREEAAMMLMGTWFLSRLQAEAPELLDRVDCFAFPAVKGAPADRTGIVLGGTNAAYAIAERCLHKPEAFALLTELASDETASAWAATGRIPALKAEALEPILDPQSRKPARLLFEATGFQLYYDQSLPPRLAEMHKGTTQSLIAGTVTPEDAARKMEQTAREARD